MDRCSPGPQWLKLGMVWANKTCLLSPSSAGALGERYALKNKRLLPWICNISPIPRKSVYYTAV